MRALHGGMRAGAGTGMELCAMIGANENAQETVTANEIEVGIVIATATEIEAGIVTVTTIDSLSKGERQTYVMHLSVIRQNHRYLLRE